MRGWMDAESERQTQEQERKVVKKEGLTEEGRFSIILPSLGPLQHFS